MTGKEDSDKRKKGSLKKKKTLEQRREGEIPDEVTGLE